MHDRSAMGMLLALAVVPVSSWRWALFVHALRTIDPSVPTMARGRALADHRGLDPRDADHG